MTMPHSETVPSEVSNNDIEKEVKLALQKLKERFKNN